MENTSPEEYQKLLDLEDAMDPLWWKREDTKGPKIGDADLDNLPEEHSSFETQIDGEKSEAESISNDFRTVYENKASLDRMEEERHRLARRRAKALLQYSAELGKILEEFPTVFAGASASAPSQVSRTLAEHVIELIDGASLDRSPGMRRRSQEHEAIIEENISEFLKAKLIYRLDGPVAHACQAHLVCAPGRAPRLTIDYRPVNAVTKPDSFPLPRMDELLYGFAGSEVFSTVDALKGFYHIPMHPKSKHLTAFRTKSGVYVWNVMPLGLKNAPATFQRFMTQTFEHLPFVKVYIDDIVIHSPDAPTHLQHIRRVLETCKEKGITLKSSKCHFLKSKLKILGYYISKDGITQDTEKLASIREFQAPSDVRTLKRFLGMIQFFRMFSASTARILIPLYNLCRKGVRWRWKEEEQDAFEKIKAELLKTRTLAFPDLKKKFYVSVDASDFAFGANLYQFRNAPDGTLEIDQVLAYSDEWTSEELAEFRKEQKIPFIVESFSKKWNKHEVNYSTSEKECLAIVNALERWAHYLAPKEFEVWSDHRALTSLVKTEKPRLKRWKLRLTPFNFDLKWKAGRTMKDVDTLSRDARFQSMYVDVIKGFRIDNLKSHVDHLASPEEEFSALTFREIEFDFAEDCAAHPYFSMTEEWCLNSEAGASEDDPPEGADLPEGDTEEAKKKEQRERQIDEEVRRALLRSHYDFGVSQRNDDTLRQLIEQIERGEPQSGYCLRDDGVLLFREKIVVPKHEIPLLLWLMHDHPLSGHVGANKLKARIRERFYIKKLDKVVTKYLKFCSCSRSKARQTHRTGRTITFSHYGPLDCLQIDLVGPFPLSRGGNQYWVTLIDRYTRCLELVPVKSKDAKVIARAIADHWVTRYGCPLVLIADNEFRADVLKELLTITGTSQIHTAPYRPSTNGLCERVHQFCQQVLQNARLENATDWDIHLPAIRFAIMSSRLDGFGFSPYQLLFGRSPRLPVDELIPSDSNVPSDLAAYFDTQMEVIKDIRNRFDYTQSKVDARLRYHRDRDQNRRPTTLQVGDLVYHTRSYYGKSKLQKGLVKLLGKFAGPSLIVRSIGENTFEVQTSETKTKIFNVRDLVRYEGAEPPVYRERPGRTTLSDPDQNPEGSETELAPSDEQQERTELKVESKSPDVPELPRVPEERPTSEYPVDSKRRVHWEDQRPNPKKVRIVDPPAAMEEPMIPDDPDFQAEGQWVLAYDKELHRQGKTSLMIGQVTGIDADGQTTIQCFRPRSIKKVVKYLPIYYRYTGAEDDAFEERITDQPLGEDWLPWLVDLDHKVHVVARSSVRELDRSPPSRFIEFYRLVWDGEKRESDHPEDGEKRGSDHPADQNPTPELRSGRLKRVAAKENPASLRRSKRRKSSG